MAPLDLRGVLPAMNLGAQEILAKTCIVTKGEGELSERVIVFLLRKNLFPSRGTAVGFARIQAKVATRWTLDPDHLRVETSQDHRDFRPANPGWHSMPVMRLSAKNACACLAAQTPCLIV